MATANVLFDRVLAQKDRLVLYSKKDLAAFSPDFLHKWHALLGQDCLLVDARNRKDAKKIIDLVAEKYYKMQPPPPLGLRAMVIGMPNVGKSTLVNTLRQVGMANLNSRLVSTKVRKVARTGGQPGVTKNTSEIIRLSAEPNILVHDTPGVFLPTVKDSETMLALSLVGCVHTLFVDPVIQADYLLYVLNLQDPSGSKYGEYMDHPTNSVDELLLNIARTRNKLRPDGTYDEQGIATHWTNLWKQGKSDRFKGLFDLGAILDISGDDLRALFRAERERVASMGVSAKITDSLGEDGTARSKHRNRTAKDREYDLRNQLFKR